MSRWALPILALAMAPAPALAGTARIAPFGTNAKGEVVEAVTLVNRRGMKVVILTRGGALAEIAVPDRRGRLANVVLTRPDFAAWDRGGAFNTLIGRYANRIAGGGFSIDGQRYALPANPETGVTIHGGQSQTGGGWGTKLWTARLFEDRSSAGVELRLTSPDGDNGFPGAVTVSATYRLSDAGELRLDWRAETTRPTHLNVTNHAYFNLAGPGQASVDRLRLRLFASRYTPVNERLIPTGEVATVAGTPLDFRAARPIGPALRSAHPQIVLARGIDHNLVIDGPAGTLRPAAELVDPVSGRWLLVSTTEPGVQVYTANNFNGSQPAGAGLLLRQGDGIAFETQHFPDSPNQPAFPSTLLRPGEVFTSTTVFAFGVTR
ncbi:aldose epimerase family protein [Novosphingobium piscinae]|uniref:Aldose 1-epimerase n=1 Tax=Novosphingobium piscinae TaxID=1507448 RepID=A0A7X1KQP0_9SPHN|nr:aldose epimerase family protein [Novosphingobium piscinae]MBC2669765.1 galactose mutarotase [Novosphingobium piscinae]